MKKPLVLTLAAVILLAAFAIVKLWPETVKADDDDHINHDEGGYMIFIEPSLVKSVKLSPKGSEAFTIVAQDDGFYLEGGCDPEELYATAIYAATLSYYKILDKTESPLSDYGLDPPQMTVTVNDEISFSIGGLTLDGGAYYVLMNGDIFVVDFELAEQLLLPKNAYRIRQLWPGEPGDRPTLTEISVTIPPVSSRLGGYTIIRNDLDDDAPIGLSRYELTAPISFVCNDDSVRSKVINGILAIDLDEIAEDVEFLEGICHTLKLKAEGFEQTLYIGGVAPNGGRYLKLEGNDTVYIDMLGDYGFLDIAPLDLTYGLAFWLYSIGDVESITVTDKGRERTVPEDISEMNKRRFFSHVLNFSVSDMATEYNNNFDNKIALKMVDGSIHELRFARQNERQLAVSVDGGEPVFACNIKDWQQIIEDLDALDAGQGIREG